MLVNTADKFTGGRFSTGLNAGRERVNGVIDYVKTRKDGLPIIGTKNSVPAACPIPQEKPVTIVEKPNA